MPDSGPAHYIGRESYPEGVGVATNALYPLSNFAAQPHGRYGPPILADEVIASALLGVGLVQSYGTRTVRGRPNSEDAEKIKESPPPAATWAGTSPTEKIENYGSGNADVVGIDALPLVQSPFERRESVR
jgi:hypothetical protein